MQRDHYSSSARVGSAPRAAFAFPEASPKVCEACSRRFVVIKAPGDDHAHVCTVCGGALVEATLAPGVYEIGGAQRPLRRRARKAHKASAQAASTVPREADVGYNESHGYGPSHGGPSGPGDAPAAPAPPVKGDQEAKGDPGSEDEEAPKGGANDKRGEAGE